MGDHQQILRFCVLDFKITGENRRGGWFSHYKYGLISMLIFSVVFSIGNWFQLKASWNRPLGFGERHHAFYDGFLVVLVYLLLFSR